MESLKIGAMHKISGPVLISVFTINLSETQLFFPGMKSFDVSVFDAELAMSSYLIRGGTVEEQAQALVKPGKTRMTGGMFRFLGNVIYKNLKLLRAMDIE